MRRILAHSLALLLLSTSVAAANDVVVAIKGGKLSVKGDADSNFITIDGTALAADSIRITPGGGTTVNGLAGPQIFTGFVEGVTIKLGDGSDNLEVFQKTLAGKVAIGLGKGSDQLRIEDATLGGPSKIDLGGGDDGFAACDALFQSDVTVKLGKGTGGNVSTTCGAGSASTSNASVLITLDTLFQSGLTLKAAPGVHVGVFDDTAVQGPLSSKNVPLLALCYASFADVTVKMPKILGNFGGEVSCVGGMLEGFANGNTAMVIVDTPVNGVLSFKGNAGGDTLVVIGTQIGGTATLDAGAGLNFAFLDQVSMPSFLAKAGKNDDDLFVQQTAVSGDVTIKYGAGNNVIDFATDTTIGGNLAIKTGAGNDSLVLGANVVGTTTIDLGKGTNTQVNP
jgi:hypothetical protein